MDRYREIKVRICPGVYPPAEDTYLLVDGVLDHIPPGEGVRSFLEVGSGTGMASVAAAKRGYEVYFCDVNPRAVDCTRENLMSAGFDGMAVDARGFFEDGDEKYDVIAFNPPYLPGRVEGERWWKQALEGGGPQGSDVIERFLKALPGHMVEGSISLIILSSTNAPFRIKKEHREFHFRVLKRLSMGLETLYLVSLKLRVK